MSQTMCAHCGSLNGGHTLACQSIHSNSDMPAQVPATTPQPTISSQALTELSNVEPDLAWSSNQEDWQHDELEDLLQHLHDNDELEAGRIVWSGEKRKPAARNFVPDSGYIVDRMNENAGDSDGGEWAEDFAAGVDPAALKELDAYLEAWADKHCPVTWWLIERTSEYTITAEDVASVAGDRG